MGDINQSLLDNIFIQRILLLEPILIFNFQSVLKSAATKSIYK